MANAVKLSVKIFQDQPVLERQTEVPNVYVIALKNMITPWWVIHGAWMLAGAILALLHQPWLGLIAASVGMGMDAGLQRTLRRRLRDADARDPEAGVERLGWIVILRFSVGVAGPVAVALLSPSLQSIAVLLLMQAWSFCVAVVQFSCSNRLFRRAIAAPIAATLVGMAPLMASIHGVAVLLAMGLLIAVLLLIGHESEKAWRSWVAACAHNAALLDEIGQARDQALRDRALAERARDEAALANGAKTAFLATMSHEIRTPLNGVLGMAQAMAHGELSEAQRERLAVIRKAGESLTMILNDVLDLSKVEAGRMEIEEIEFDLAHLLQGAHEFFAAVADAKGLSLDLQIDDTVRGAYRGDPTRLRQIVNNLVSNALKFTARGGVRITAAHNDAENGGPLRILVSDTGPGIAADQQAMAFDRFVQLDSSTTRRHGGTGLGLAICKELCELMGGQVTVDSEVGQGATFIVSLPLRRVHAADSSLSEDCSGGFDGLAGRPLRILAAEDNKMNQFVLKTLLDEAGLDLTVVDNGAQAVEAWATGRWDVVLMDVHMPVMDGIVAAREIRAREIDRGWDRTPIVALTGNAMIDQIAAVLSAGMDAHVSKPIDVRELFSVIAEMTDPARSAAHAPVLSADDDPSSAEFA